MWWAFTKGDEVDAEDEDTTHKECGGLAEVPGEVLQQQQSDDVGRDLDGSRQEGVEVGVAMQVGGVEDQGVVADGNDEPESFTSPGLVTWGTPARGWRGKLATTHQRNEQSRVTLKVLQLRRMTKTVCFFSLWDRASSTWSYNHSKASFIQEMSDAKGVEGWSLTQVFLGGYAPIE